MPQVTPEDIIPKKLDNENDFLWWVIYILALAIVAGGVTGIALIRYFWKRSETALVRELNAHKADKVALKDTLEAELKKNEALNNEIKQSVIPVLVQQEKTMDRNAAALERNNRTLERLKLLIENGNE